MTHNNECSDNQIGETAEQDVTRNQRRQLLKRGALLAPVVFTLHARPAAAEEITYGINGYASYFTDNGVITGEQTGTRWRTQDEARNNDVAQ